MIFISFFLALVFTFFIISIVKFPNRVAFVLGIYLAFISNIIFSLLIINLFQVLNDKYLLLVIQSILTIIGLLVWLQQGHPTIKYLFDKKFFPFEISNISKNIPILLLGLAVAAAYILAALIIYIVPPNNNDSLSTHLSRIGYWLQHGSVLPWSTFWVSQIYYPINISLQVFWTVLFWGSDKLAGFVQWFGGIISIISVFGIARLLHRSQAQSAFAAFIWGSFPIILMQSTTTQLDLAAAGIFLPSVYFLILGVQTQNKGMFILSGLSLALAIGTKQTVWLLLPGFGLFLIILFSYWKKHIKHLFIWISSTFIFFILLSSYIFIINYINFKNPVGPNEVVKYGSVLASPSQKLIYNIPRFTYQAIDFSGLPTREQGWGLRVKSILAGGVFKLVKFPIEAPIAVQEGHVFDLDYRPPVTEDESWFGILGVLLLFSAAVLEFIDGLKNKDIIKVGLFIFSLSFFPIIVLIRPGWDLYQGRYFIIAAGLIAPFMSRWVQEKIMYKICVWSSVILSLIIIFSIMVYNPAKPLISNRINIITAGRQNLQGLQTTFMRPYMKMVYDLPEHTVIAYYSPGYIWDYPLFGEHFERTVIPIVSEESLLQVSALKAQHIEYVLTYSLSGESYAVDPSMELVNQEDNVWVLYKVP